MDLFLIIKNNYTVTDISRKTETVFKENFNEKLFRLQLAFHKDISYKEEVEYLVPQPSDKEIKQFLIDKTIDF